MQLNKILFRKIFVDHTEIWIADYDGNSAKRIPIILPSGIVFSDDVQPMISNDWTKIFFTATSIMDKFKGDLYSCSIDGSNVRKIVDRGETTDTIILDGVY